MLVKVFGAAVFGINATIVTAEVNVEPGAYFQLVGLPDSAVKESQQRIDAALRNNGLYAPRGKGVTINLAPADIRKEGTAYDLPLAVGLLVCTGADYHQFVLAARRPSAVVIGCLLAGVALIAIGFLPPALVVTIQQAGALTELSDSKQVIPLLLARITAEMGPGADKVMLVALSTAALGSGAAILRAMASALGCLK